MRSVRFILISAAVLALLLLLPTFASADGIAWTFNNVTLSDGGTVTGPFDYNAVTNTYSAINLSSTFGTLLNGTSYSTLSPVFFYGSTLLGVGPASIPGGNFAGLTFMELFFTNPLTNTGGTDPVQAFEIFCGPSSTCTDPTVRSSTSGYVTSVPISTPEPASFLLLAGGLLAIALFRRR